MKEPGFGSNPGWRLSVWDFHVLLVSACIPSVYSRLLTQSKDMHVNWVNWGLEVNRCESECGCLSLYVIPGCTLPGIGSSPLVTLCRTVVDDE